MPRSPTFSRQADKLFNEEERRILIDFLAENPLAGDEIPRHGRRQETPGSGFRTRQTRRGQRRSIFPSFFAFSIILIGISAAGSCSRSLFAAGPRATRAVGAGNPRSAGRGFARHLRKGKEGI